MAKEDRISKFWDDLATKAEKIPGGRRIMEKLKQEFLENEDFGNELVLLEEGSVYQKAQETLLAEIEFRSFQERLTHVQKKRQNTEEGFWLEVLDKADVDKNSILHFNPVTGKIFNCQTYHQEFPDSYQISLEKYSKRIWDILFDPFVARNEANNPSQGFDEIREFAKAIIQGNWKPELRKLIEEWCKNPSKAKEYYPILVEENMPQWIIDITKNLGRRDRWRRHHIYYS